MATVVTVTGMVTVDMVVMDTAVMDTVVVTEEAMEGTEEAITEATEATDTEDMEEAMEVTVMGDMDRDTDMENLEKVGAPNQRVSVKTKMEVTVSTTAPKPNRKRNLP